MWHEVCEVFKDDTEFYPAGNICEDLKETNYKWFSLLKKCIKLCKGEFFMICPVCKGKRFFKKLVFTGQPEDKGWEEFAEPCENCDATGVIDALDNEEWFTSLSDTKKARFLANIVASGKKEYKQISFWKKWLKQQHAEE